MTSSPGSSSPSTFATLIIALLSAALGMFGQPLFTTVLDKTKEPLLAQEISSTNINSLPPELQRQISVVTTRLSLTHSSGRTAKKITISANASQDIPSAGLVVALKSEPYKLNRPTSRSFNIDIESIRPGASLVLEVTHAPSNTIQWEILAEEGAIKDASDIENESTSELGRGSRIALAIAFAALFLIVLVVTVRWASRSLITFVGNDTPMSDKGRQRLIWTLTMFVFWNFLVQSFELNVLKFPLMETLFAICIYFFVSNYKAMRTILMKFSIT